MDLFEFFQVRQPQHRRQLEEHIASRPELMERLVLAEIDDSVDDFLKSLEDDPAFKAALDQIRKEEEKERRSSARRGELEKSKPGRPDPMGKPRVADPRKRGPLDRLNPPVPDPYPGYWEGEPTPPRYGEVRRSGGLGRKYYGRDRDGYKHPDQDSDYRNIMNRLMNPFLDDEREQAGNARFADEFPNMSRRLDDESRIADRVMPMDAPGSYSWDEFRQKFPNAAAQFDHGVTLWDDPDDSGDYRWRQGTVDPTSGDFLVEFSGGKIPHMYFIQGEDIFKYRGTDGWEKMTEEELAWQAMRREQQERMWNTDLTDTSEHPGIRPEERAVYNAPTYQLDPAQAGEPGDPAPQAQPQGEVPERLPSVPKDPNKGRPVDIDAIIADIDRELGPAKPRPQAAKPEPKPEAPKRDLTLDDLMAMDPELASLLGEEPDDGKE